MAQFEDIVFRALDRESEISVSYGENLPHWFQVGAATFITFRLRDSLPKEVIHRWYRDLIEWINVREIPLPVKKSIVSLLSDDANNRSLFEIFEIAHSKLSSLDIRQSREFKRFSNRIVHRSLDECYGECILRNHELAKIVADNIRHFDGERYDLDSFIVMPNHVHVLGQFRVGYDLSLVSQSWMRFSARQINAFLGSEGAIWQPDPFDHIVRSSEQFSYLQSYIKNNPLEAKLSCSEYLYWVRDQSDQSGRNCPQFRR